MSISKNTSNLTNICVQFVEMTKRSKRKNCRKITIQKKKFTGTVCAGDNERLPGRLGKQSKQSPSN